MNWSERDHQVNWHPFSSLIEKEIITIVKSEGIYLWDENGNRYLDAVSSWWVNLHGHNHPHLVKAVSDQLKNLDHVIFAGFSHTKAIELSERLLKFVPGNYSKVFYSDDGSTANEVALKLALQYFYNRNEKRKKIIAFENAYHGDTFGVMSLNGRNIFNEAFQSHLIPEIIHIPVPVNGYTNEQWKKVKSVFNEDTAVFIFEPFLQGAAGMVMYDEATLNELISLSHKNGIITIADEVLTGFGRTGTWFASEKLKEKADLICLSKGITGGMMPLGVTLVNEKISKSFSDSDIRFYHGHSYTANALACAIACANLDLLNTDCLNSIKNIEKKHLEFISGMNHPKIHFPRVKGTILAMNFGDAQGNYQNDLRNKMYSYFIKKGLLMRPLGNVSYVLPPYCITENELDSVYQAMLDFADTI